MSKFRPVKDPSGKRPSPSSSDEGPGTNAGASPTENNAKNKSTSDKAQTSDQSIGASTAGQERPNSKAQASSVSSASATKSVPSSAVKLIRQYELVDMVKAYDPQADEDLLNKAYVFAMRAHGGQTRKSGDPYFSHPLAVAGILTELRADPASVATALLHDVVEDTDVSLEEIEQTFGKEIARLVDGVTKISKIKMRSGVNEQAENFRKLVVAMADDVRVLLVKLCDRLHNMRTLEHHPKPEKRRRIAIETMEIYAPLAGRIGVQRIREELEDLSFKVINPDAYATISARLEGLHGNVVESVVELATVLRTRLTAAGVFAEVHSREKRPYSIWRKMAAKNVSFDELADIFGFRVLVASVEDCYRTLAVIHTGWHMIPEEFDDYISAPKPNGYRSIHTAVIGPPSSDGGRQRIEVQIRTVEMHEAAERGVAAHWQYKENGAKEGETSVELSASIQYDPYETPRRLVEMFQQGEDSEEALAYAKLELFQDQVFAFTPKGEVIALPKDATALDFAYALHTDIGDSCIGAKINGAQKPLRTPLKNGDAVQILRSENAPPPAEWEKMAMTGRARAAIRRRLKKLEFDEQISLGRQIAENVFTGANLEFSRKAVRKALTRIGEKTVDNALAKIGRGEFNVSELIDVVYPGASVEIESEIRAVGIEPFRPHQAIEGLVPGVRVAMGKCCTPVPGERIVGIRDDAGAVNIHTIYCDQLAAEDPPQSQWVDLKWRTKDRDIKAYTKVFIEVRNEIGVLSDIAAIIARYGVSIANIKLEGGTKDFVEMNLDIEVSDSRQLMQMLAGLRASASVLSAERNEVDNEYG